MNFKQMNPLGKAKQSIGVFGGLNQSSVGADNEFLDMKNISSRLFPSLTLREPNVPFNESEEPVQIFYKNSLYMFGKNTLIYDEKRIALKKTVDSLDRVLVGMGAYICIFPDKQVFNTKTEELTDMESSYTQEGQISLAPVSEGSSFVKIQGKNIGKNFKRDDVVTLSGFTQYTETLNTTKAIKEIGDDFIVISAVDENGVALRSITEESGVKIVRKVPDMDYVCEFNNRLWGCSSANHEIYACKLGDPTNWNSFQGTAADSYAVSVGSDGDFTGVISQQGYVVFFKENYIHTIYGTKPSNFSLDTVEARGVMEGCSASLCHVNESVMYVSRDAVMIYQGGMPESVSDKLKVKWNHAIAGQWRGKYYVYLQNDNQGSMYVFDLKNQLWIKEADIEGKIYSLVNASGNLNSTYEKPVNGKYPIYTRNTMADDMQDYENTEWVLESVYLEEGTLDKKKVRSLQFNIELEPDAECTVYVRYDNEATWRREASITADKRNTYLIPVKLKRCERYQYKLSGHGKFTLYGMSKTIGKGSER